MLDQRMLQRPARALLDVAAVSGWAQHAAQGARPVRVWQPQQCAVETALGGDDQVAGSCAGIVHAEIFSSRLTLKDTAKGHRRATPHESYCFQRDFLDDLVVEDVVVAAGLFLEISAPGMKGTVRLLEGRTWDQFPEVG